MTKRPLLDCPAISDFVNSASFGPFDASIYIQTVEFEEVLNLKDDWPHSLLDKFHVIQGLCETFREPIGSSKDFLLSFSLYQPTRI